MKTCTRYLVVFDDEWGEMHEVGSFSDLKDTIKSLKDAINRWDEWRQSAERGEEEIHNLRIVKTTWRVIYP